jgi:hypothetical protein
MNKIIPKILNISIFMSLCFQAFIYYHNTKPSNKVFTPKSISVENFSTIVLSKSGVTQIGSEKLNKIDEYNIYLEGESYLENNDYKIYGKNISINIKSEMSSSNENVKVINSMGTLNSSSFKNFDSNGKIIFEGETTFISHE